MVRNITPSLIAEIDHALRVLEAGPYLSAAGKDSSKKISRRLMRINHGGEVLAQALYRGATTALYQDEATAGLLRQAGEEEFHHLILCRDRIIAIGGRVSVINPLCYMAGFGIGWASGMLGRETALGFVAETEKQVAQHLREHLAILSQTDQSSAEILQLLLTDEEAHQQKAEDSGGKKPPAAVCLLMDCSSRIWKSVSAYL